MNATTTIPLLITPEAETHIDQIGMRSQFEQIIEHGRRTIPGLYQLEADVEPPYDLGGGDIILIRGYRHPSGSVEDDPTDREFGRWKVTTFPPEVCLQFVLLTCEVPQHAG
jgi:hypothetical protein